MFSNSKLQTIILTSRLPESEAFYRDALGLTVAGKSDGAVVFDVGGSELRVSPVSATRPSEHTIAGFSVEDIDSAVDYLHNRGVELVRFEKFTHQSNGVLETPYGSRVAWFRDPDGNLLSVVQYGESR